jgi:hypothetical protein
VSRRRWLGVSLGVLVLALAVTPLVLPSLVRHVAIARIHALTQRPVAIDRVELALLSGRATVHGFRLAERDGQAPFADFERLDLRLHLPSLLSGHLWLRDLVLTRSTVRVVRLPSGEFNFSDLIRQSGASEGGTLDVTVDRLAIRDGTVLLEDRALPEPRTWTSEQIAIEASNVSTRRADGHAVGRSVTAGAPVSVEVRDLRLHPIHLQALVTVEGLDLTPAQVYLPADAAVLLTRGRASASVTLALDAREGLRMDSAGRFEDIELAHRGDGQPLARVPRLTMRVGGFGMREGDGLRLADLAVEGSMSVRDPRTKQDAPFRASTVRASVRDLTWPATTPGRLDLVMSIPGGGSLALTGAVQPPPAASDLRLRVASLDLAPWAQFVPVAARVTGTAEADLRVRESLGAGVPARVQGAIAVDRPTVGDGRRAVLAARRAEASGLSVHWPSRVVVDRVLVTGLRGTVERDRDGSFPARELLGRPPSSPTPARGPARPATAAPTIEVGEIRLRDGALAWRDRAVTPAARLDVANVDATVTGVTWPLQGRAGVRLAVRPPGGGQVRVTGDVGVVDPFSVDVRIVARDADLAPYQPYLPTRARLTGAADLDVAVVVPSLEELRATARGRVALRRLDVRDGERTLVRVERAQATGVDVEWPERIAVARVALAQPWIVVERDARGELPLRRLLAPAASATDTTGPAVPGPDEGRRTTPSVTVAELSADGGGVRVVDQAVAPAFAVDVQPVALRVRGLSTTSEQPARVDLRGRVGPGSELTLRGTVRALGGPLQVDVRGEVRDFAVPRANPYVLQQAGWKTTDGRLTSTLQARIDGDALAARTEIRVSQLQLVRATPEDGAEARIGLPLNMLTALMKDRRGDITIAFPVGGRLGDPKFDFSEAIWKAVRTVAVNAITLPVSWIGRVRVAPDSRIERIDIDPVGFQPGTATPSSAGQVQATRLAAFLAQLPEVRMAVTPIVSPGDLAAMKRRDVEQAIARVERQARLSREAAAARVFEQTFPGLQAPESVGAIVGALVEQRAVPDAAVVELTQQRLDAVRQTVRSAGVDPDRLLARDPVERDTDGGLAVEVVPPATERPSRLRETLRRLGVPVKADP